MRIFSFLDFAQNSIVAGTNRQFYRMIFDSPQLFKTIDLTSYQSNIPLSLLLKFISIAGEQLQVIRLPTYFNSTDTLK